MTDEPAFITRLREEHEQLSGRIEKLSGFIAGGGLENVSGTQRMLLGIQLSTMEAYEGILSARLKDLS